MRYVPTGISGVHNLAIYARVSAVNAPNYESKTYLHLTFTSHGLERGTPPKRMVAYVVSILESGRGCRGAREGGWKEGHNGCGGSFEEASNSG